MPILGIGFYIDNYFTAIVVGKLKRESTIRFLTNCRANE